MSLTGTEYLKLSHIFPFILHVNILYELNSDDTAQVETH